MSHISELLHSAHRIGFSYPYNSYSRHRLFPIQR